MQIKSVGRPAIVHYSEADCQLNVKVPVELKRSLVERADRTNGRIKDEVSAALIAHLEHDEEGFALQ